MTRTAHFKFRLYTADNSQNSVQALANLKALCAKYLPGRHEIEVVDVFAEPLRALSDKIRMTPTLLKVGPVPALRIVGNLNQTAKVLLALGLESLPS